MDWESPRVGWAPVRLLEEIELDPQPLNPEATRERAAAWDSLAAFGELLQPGYAAGALHELLAEKLEDCFKRKIKRLILNVPPQHGKSLTSSILFPAWALTRDPTLRIFQAGHTSDLSRGFSREARALVTSDKYLEHFATRLNPRVNRERFWKTTAGGYYYATTVGGGTGVSADVLIVDDPHRDRQQANSRKRRDRVWEWFTSTALTRLAPDGIVIVIQTRWHRDDLSGRLLDPKRVRALADAGFDEMNFHVLSLEALCENAEGDPLRRRVGDALWPEMRPINWLKAQKLQITSAEWNALYQQRPNPPGGNIVDIRNIKLIPRDRVPEGLELQRGWDLALGDGNAADYSAGARGAVDKAGNFYLIHMDRGKRKWPEQRARIITLAEHESMGGRISIEAVGAWQTAVADLKQHFRGRVMVRHYAPTTDKMVRALPWFAKIDGGMFHMVEGEWNQDFLDELEQFPNGAHDDQIDAVTVLNEGLTKKSNFVMA